MFYIGCHLSCAKGYLPMIKEAEKIGATAFQFFTRNPRGGNAKALDDVDLEAFLRKKEELGIGALVAHAPYTLNGCSADESVREFAWRTMVTLHNTITRRLILQKARSHPLTGSNFL